LSGRLRVAIAGLGLIGGSVGIAARRRLGAHVVGWNRSPAACAIALERGAIDEAVECVADMGDVDIAIAAVSVDALEDVSRRLCAAAPGAVVTDVGSTKQALVAALTEDGFIGGHPLAGAEVTGIEHAREDLFEAATWYLTPRPSTSGVLYERLAKFVSDLGAVPTAIPAADHDRLMAAVSHLPHVIANLLVEQASAALGGETLPATGPSFRDATRVAGANPRLWEQIYRANARALDAQIDDVIRRLHDVRSLLGEPGDGLVEWQASAGRKRQALLEVGLGTGDRQTLQVVVPNEPGVVARIALALGQAGVNIADMSLSPAPDNSVGTITLWIGALDVARASDLVAALGYDVVGSPGVTSETEHPG